MTRQTFTGISPAFTGISLAMCSCLFVVLLASSAALAMPAYPLPVEVEQPDGSKITIRVFGDEHFNWYEDMAGYTVVPDHGLYVYAQLDAQKRLAPTHHVVGKADPAALGMTRKLLPPPAVRNAMREQTFVVPSEIPNTHGAHLRAVPPSGNVKNLVVLCKFSDHTLGVHTRDPADYDVLWNAVGGHPSLAPTGSVRDVYFENSYGTMDIDSTVTVWVTLPHTQAYYANGSSGLDGSYPANPQGMVEDALDAVDPLIDFGDFDTDDDGYIDAISIIHSGYGAETGGGGGNWIWSHRWALFQLPGGQWFSNDVNGLGANVKVYDYHTEPALWGTSGTSISRIAVAAHETGHFFGLPDLYDTDGGGEGIGSYCMMANSWGFDFSQRYPPHFSAWCKIFLGWVTPTVLNTPGIYSIPQVETSPVVYRINQGYSATEYLLVENRQPYGFEAILPQGGLAIWHIDETKCCNTQQGYPGQPGWPANNNHYRVALLQADGNYQLEKGQTRGQGDELYHAGGVSLISDETVPNTDRYQFGNIVVTHNALTNISGAAANMSFKYLQNCDIVPGTTNDCNENNIPDECEPDCDESGIVDECEIVAGSSVDCNLNGVPDECELVGGDCNGNGVPDDCDLAGGTSEDCNFNAVPDTCDIDSEYSEDCNNNSIPDTCEILGGSESDCNGNSVPDSCDIALGFVADCNTNGIPDNCDLASLFSEDCNVNGYPDECEVAGGTSFDCNGNDILDDCDTLPGGASLDCNDDVVPDECQIAGNDCNVNSVPDDCDAAALAATIDGPFHDYPCADGVATFNVSVAGADSYQWIRNGSEVLSDGGVFSGANSPTLTIDPAGDGGDLSTYQCRVDFGCLQAYSDVAQLRLAAPALEVTLTSPSPISDCVQDSGGIVIFTVSVDDPTGVSYQWSLNGEDLANNGHFTGTTTAQIHINGVEPADGGDYTCRVWNACLGEENAETATAVLDLADPVFALPPTDQCAEYGANAVFHGEVTGTYFFVHRWYEGTTLLSEGGKFTGTTTNTLTVHNVQAGDDGRQFRLRAIVVNPSCSGYSDPATLTARSSGLCPPPCPGTPGDMDDDGDFDLVDMQRFGMCFGADVIAQPECACGNMDYANSTVDLADWMALEQVISGPQ